MTSPRAFKAPVGELMPPALLAAGTLKKEKQPDASLCPAVWGGMGRWENFRNFYSICMEKIVARGRRHARGGTFAGAGARKSLN